MTGQPSVTTGGTGVLVGIAENSHLLVAVLLHVVGALLDGSLRSLVQIRLVDGEEASVDGQRLRNLNNLLNNGGVATGDVVGIALRSIILGSLALSTEVFTDTYLQVANLLHFGAGILVQVHAVIVHTVTGIYQERPTALQHNFPLETGLETVREVTVARTRNKRSTARGTTIEIEMVATVGTIATDGVNQIPVEFQGRRNKVESAIIAGICTRAYAIILGIKSQTQIGIEAITKFNGSHTAKVILKRTETEVIILSMIQTTHQTHEPSTFGGHIHILVLHRNNGILSKRCHRQGRCCKENKNFLHMVNKLNKKIPLIFSFFKCKVTTFSCIIYKKT